MYDALARSLFEPVSERVAEEVRRARNRRPRSSRSELAESVVRRAAVRSGVVAALAAAPSGWLSLLPATGDFSFQVLSLHRTALAVPQALRRRTTPAERALATAASLAAAGASLWLRDKAIRSARRSWRSAPSPAVRSVVHAIIGASLSAAAVLAVGKATRDYCRRVPPP